MEIKIFSDVIDAIDKLGKIIVSIKGIPKEQRDRQIMAVTEAFTLLDSALMLVINRLGDLVHIDSEKEFWKELARVAEGSYWMEIERDIRLCRNLRTAGKELKGFYWRSLDAFGSRDSQNIRTLVDNVLEQEYHLSEFISSSLSGLPGLALTADWSNAITSVVKVRETAKSYRRRLIALELGFWETITETKHR